MGEEFGSNNPLVGLLKSLPSEQRGQVIRSFVSMIEPTIKSALEESFRDSLEGSLRDSIKAALSEPAVQSEMTVVIGGALRELGYTDEITRFVRTLAERSHNSKEAVLRKALNLFKFALDTRDEGNRLSVLSPDDEIVHEIVGFEPAAEPTPAHKVAG